MQDPCGVVNEAFRAAAARDEAIDRSAIFACSSARDEAISRDLRMQLRVLNSELQLTKEKLKDAAEVIQDLEGAMFEDDKKWLSLRDRYAFSNSQRWLSLCEGIVFKYGPQRALYLAAVRRVTALRRAKRRIALLDM